MDMVYACGSNYFGQLSGYSVDVCTLDENVHTNQCFKTPTLLGKVNKKQLLKAAFTWSRLVATTKSEAGMTTHVSGFLANKSQRDYPDMMDKEIEAHQIYPKTEFISVTDSDIYLSSSGDQCPTHILLDGECDVVPLCLEKHRECNPTVSAICGGHKDLFLAYDTLSFGKLLVEGKKHKQDTKKGCADPCLMSHLYPIDSGLNITRVSCGKEHVLLLSQHGSVYSYGLGSRGQLGHGTVEMESSPRLIEALEGLRVKELDAGGWHSAAVAESRDLYTWGWNEIGQLGHPALKISAENKRKSSKLQDDFIGILAEPRCAFDVSSEERITSVSCGSRHTLCLNDIGQVFSAGWNCYGQLGLGDFKSRDNFTHLQMLRETCIKIKAGQWNSLFICTDQIK